MAVLLPSLLFAMPAARKQLTSRNVTIHNLSFMVVYGKKTRGETVVASVLSVFVAGAGDRVLMLG